MILDILFNHVCRHFIADRAGEISIFPKLPTPPLFLHFRVGAKELTGRNTFEDAHRLSDRVAWGKRQKYMHVVLNQFQLFNGKVKLFGSPIKHLASMVAQRAMQNPLAIFGCSYQMVLRIINA